MDFLKAFLGTNKIAAEAEGYKQQAIIGGYMVGGWALFLAFMMVLIYRELRRKGGKR
ncbi:hypothetical protein KS4_16180 [Poriferisphaera corsica]|uniref:Uncharacterized protein n=1 Tax=Poriferisphaera corsica TaxID=2528020 RepID=A0A517YTM0_9BACT|nr:hypothetical protein [Poriferisphaera corsica]QDU33567.1 hypothetical protein KS4_16180 [Poriferisphaera corsica]